MPPPLGKRDGEVRAAQHHERDEVVDVPEAVGHPLRDLDLVVYRLHAGIAKAIAKAIANGTVSRDMLFVTSKVWNTDRGYDKTMAAFEIAQLCIRFCLQNDVLPLPKSVTPSRTKENLDVFDFQISEEDMQTIRQLPDFGSKGLDPDKVDF